MASSCIGYVKEDPELIRRFVTASIRGFLHAHQHPDEAVAITKKISEAVVPEIARRELEMSWDTWVTPNTAGKALGWMSDKDWESTVQVLKGYRRTTPLQASVLYTNDLVPRGLNASLHSPNRVVAKQRAAGDGTEGTRSSWLMSSDGLLTTLAQKADPGCAALLVIDVQSDFAADGGFFDRIGADVRSINDGDPSADPARRLRPCSRNTGCLRTGNLRPERPLGAHAGTEPAPASGNAALPDGVMGRGFSRVRPALGEPVVIKHRYSAMHKTELDAILKRHGICSLLLSGIATDTCVESTGRDAYFMDYYVTLVADCCGAFDESDHLGAIKRFDRDYGAVVTSDDLIDTWERRAQSVKRDVAATHG